MTTNTEGAPEGQRANPLQALDNLLHCGICFDYFNIAMIIPQCSHNYCSLCIRKFLSYKTQCPTCFVTVTEPDLRNNRRLDDLVQAFLATRKNLPQHTGSPPSSSQNPSKDKVASTRSEGFSTKKNKQEGTSMEKFLVRKSERSKRTLESSTEESLDTSLPAELISAKKIKQEAEDSVTEYSASQEPSTSVPKVSIKLECPVCGVGIPEQYINKHLDSCLTRDEKKESLRSSGQKRRPVAKVVYNLLSERDLRKRLKEVGLSTHGTKQQMIRRHQEFVQMYNAQCDSLNPKSAAEIVKEIETSEKVRASLEAKKETMMTFKKEQSEEEIDEIHQQYRNKHKSEFQQLVEQVKGRWKAGKKAKEEPVAENIPDDQDTKDTAIDEEVTEITENGESLEDCFQRTANTSAVRSDSPIFPLSPDSRISSSSDILRDIEEAAVPQESKSALNHSEPKNRKRKTTSGKEEAATRYPRTPRSKRQRK